MGSSSDIEIITKPSTTRLPAPALSSSPILVRSTATASTSASTSTATTATAATAKARPRARRIQQKSTIPPSSSSSSTPVIVTLVTVSQPKSEGMSVGEREDLTHRTRGFMSNKGKERERSPLPITALESEVKGDRKELEKKQEVWVLSDEEQELQLFFARKPSNKLRKPKGKRGAPSSSIATASSSDSDNVPSSSPASNTRSPPKRGRGRPRHDGQPRPDPAKAVKSWERSAAFQAAAARGSRAGNRKRKVCGESGEDEEVTERKRAAVGRLSSSDSDNSYDGRGEEGFVRRVEEVKGREKSRSLTPPEAVEQYRLDAVLGNLRENLGPAPEEYDSDEQPAPTPPRSQPSPQKRPLANAGNGEGEGSMVVISVSMVPDPDMTSVIAMNYYSTPLEFSMNSQERFENLTHFVATKKSKSPSEIILTYIDRKIYQFGTPDSLKIYEKASFRGYTIEAWEKIAKKKEAAERKRVLLEVVAREKERSASPVGREVEAREDSLELEPIADDSLIIVPPPPPDVLAQPDDPSSPAAPTNLIKLTLRGSQTDILPLMVRPTMKISSLLKQYCKAFNVDSARREGMWIEFDGEKLDNGIGIGEVEDFEDEEVLDVRGAR